MGTLTSRAGRRRETANNLSAFHANAGSIGNTDKRTELELQLQIQGSSKTQRSRGNNGDDGGFSTITSTGRKWNVRGVGKQKPDIVGIREYWAKESIQGEANHRGVGEWMQEYSVKRWPGAMKIVKVKRH